MPVRSRPAVPGGIRSRSLTYWIKAPLAQLVELLICNQMVAGSSPAGGSKRPFRLSVRTSGFHPEETSSILVGATKIYRGEVYWLHLWLITIR